MSSIEFDESQAVLDKEILKLTIKKDISSLECSSLEWQKKRAEASKIINNCKKNIEELQARIEEKNSEYVSLMKSV